TPSITLTAAGPLGVSSVTSTVFSCGSPAVLRLSNGDWGLYCVGAGGGLATLKQPQSTQGKPTTAAATPFRTGAAHTTGRDCVERDGRNMMRPGKESSCPDE